MGQHIDYSEYNMILWGKGENIVHYPNWFLNFEHLEDDYDYIMFLKFDNNPEIPNPNIPELVKSLNYIYSDDQNAFVLLTNRKSPPLYMARADELIYSFCCNFYLFKKVIKAFGDTRFYSRNFLFEILDHIFKSSLGFDKVYVRQMPIENLKISKIPKGDIIVPHRGNETYLQNLLKFITQTDQTNVLIGLDQETNHELITLKNKYDETSFFDFSPNPVGPYVIRNWLIDSSKGELIYFQDSDDIPCADRFTMLSDYMYMNKCDWCGSHEIKMDYYNKFVQAIRYPVNVMAALTKGPGHSLLLPASVIKRNSFYLGGKLSEERIFGNDTKFLYHSYFLFNNIKNIDEFLYIRRIHPDSLTTSIDTGLDSPIRRELLKNWVREFDRVKNGILNLERTTLLYKGSELQFNVKKL